MVGAMKRLSRVVIHHDYYGFDLDGLVRATFGGNPDRPVHAQVKFT